jgi:hypothetical protein
VEDLGRKGREGSPDARKRRKSGRSEEKEVRTLGREGREGSPDARKRREGRESGRSEEKRVRTLGGYDRQKCAAILAVVTLRGPQIVPAGGVEDLGA